jgi:hypothetical protein
MYIRLPAARQICFIHPDYRDSWRMIEHQVIYEKRFS